MRVCEHNGLISTLMENSYFFHTSHIHAIVEAVWHSKAQALSFQKGQLFSETMTSLAARMPNGFALFIHNSDKTVEAHYLHRPHTNRNVPLE